jgi:hypothetical protein
MSWRWIWQRVHAAGRDAAMQGVPLEPLPRRLHAYDRIVLAQLAPLYLHDRYVTGRRAPGS